jgi:hypothetical protein
MIPGDEAGELKTRHFTVNVTGKTRSNDVAG